MNESATPRQHLTPDQMERLARLRSQPKSDPSPASGAAPTARRRKQHPARGARTVALAASVAATAGVGGAMAYADAVEPTSFVASIEAVVAGDAPVPTTAPLELPTIAAATPSATTADDALPTAVEVPTVTAEPVAVAAAEPTAEPIATTATAAPTAIATETPVEVAAAPVASAAAASGLGNGVFAGTAEYTEWGNVQVQITVADGQLVDVVSLQMPSSRKSSEINNAAEPVLEAQAIATQSADLDVVSGATFTSNTYEISLQAALDQAALAAIDSQAAGQ